jgi:hypothetical protein
MEAARPGLGPQRRKLWTLIASLTAVGLAGVVIEVVGFFVAAGNGFGGGCAMAGIGFLMVLVSAVVVLFFVGLVGVLASLGLALFWRGSLWGPGLLIASNFLAMAFYALAPVYPGQVAWAATVLVLASAPAFAVVLLLPGLLSHGTIRLRVLELAVLGLIGLPLVWLWVGGVSSDVTAASTLPPAIHHSAASTC